MKENRRRVKGKINRGIMSLIRTGKQIKVRGRNEKESYRGSICR